MPTLTKIFQEYGIALYQNETLDLDHYYQEPYQDQDESLVKANEPYETDRSKKIRRLAFLRDANLYSNFTFFMDGSRRTYKIADMVVGGKKIYPVVGAQIRSGCVFRGESRKVQSCGNIVGKNSLLISSDINDEDFRELRMRIQRTTLAKELNLEVIPYKVNPQKGEKPTDAAIAKANSIMHEMEVELLRKMVESDELATDRMLIVDGSLQFIGQDSGTPDFADLFYNVVGVSKSFDPMMPIEAGSRRNHAQVGAELLKLRYGDRTPVFYKRNSKGRSFGCWYLRIRHPAQVSSPLGGIVKIEKMAIREDWERGGLDTDVVDNISLSILNESIPTCYGKDDRWPNHLYPVYLAETMIKSTFLSNDVFIHRFRRNFI